MRFKHYIKVISILITVFVLTGCATNYPLTTFYVKNNTDKTLNFKASIIKFSSMTGPFEMTLPFEVPANDSIIARKAGFRKDALPTSWFTKFIIFPSDNIIFNDPNQVENWKLSKDTKGKSSYTFTLTK